MTEYFNNPGYYKVNGQDSMQLIISLVAEIADDTEETVYLFNIFKYLIRHKRKNEVEDLVKAKDYLNRLIECEGEQ